jgi:glycosyltransferase involved in cell wall biosynthesis
MSRFAKRQRVFFVEEPVYDAGPQRMESVEALPNLFVCTPHLPGETKDPVAAQRELLERYLSEREVHRPLAWFYTPMALPLIANIDAPLVAYDCMDELSAFRGAPPELVARERQLFSRADLVFTGGQSLFEAKRSQHAAVFAFPSSVEATHFRTARAPLEEPDDQRDVGRPRLGFFGVLDERLDFELLASLARARPNYEFVMIGPVVKISESALPRLRNIHYLGPKSYADLPAYIAGWQAALMPFALNEATRFISPTKTLEYMAAGKPIVSTAIRDVVSPYGEAGLVRIADAASFASTVDAALATNLAIYQQACDQVLDNTSWERTWSAMCELIANAARGRRVANFERGIDSCSTI